MPFNDRGIAYRPQGRVPTAPSPISTRQLALDAKYAPTFNNRAIAYAAKGELDRAIGDYDQALKLNGNYAAAFYNRGNAKYDKGDYAHAIADYDSAIKLNPADTPR